MNRRLAALLTVFAAGCAVPPVQTYEGAPRPSAEIGILKGTKDGGFRGQFSSYARHIRGEKLEFQKVGNSLTGYPGEIHLVPGHYLVMLHCQGGGGYGFPSVDFDVLPGMTYEISCESSAGVPGKRDGSHRESPIFVVTGGGGGGGYVPSGNHGSRGSAFTSGFINGLASGLSNPAQTTEVGTVRAFIAQRYPSDKPGP